ncbi:MAG: AsmA family protein [Candidatus Omnitrophica bacterium]|nr:AsmA family protein [Candidatus Omnitrophota bacterium]
MAKKSCSWIATAVIGKIPGLSGKLLDIEKTRVSPFLGFSFENIRIYNDAGKKSIALTIDKAAIHADLVSLLRIKKLALSIDIGDIILYPSIAGPATPQPPKNDQPKSLTLINSTSDHFSPRSIDVSIYAGSFSFADPIIGKATTIARKLSGNIRFERVPLSLDQMNAVLLFGDKPYSLTLSRKQTPANGYLITLATNDFRTGADLDTSGKDLIINTISGNYGPVNFGANGKITGSRLSLRDLSCNGLKIDELTSDIFYENGIFSMQDARARGVQVNGSLVGDISSVLLVEDGVLELSKISMPLYGGEISADIVIGLKSPALPFNIFSSARGMNCNSFFTDMSKKPSRINGVLNGDFNLHGSLKDPSMIEGSGKISINNAYLGPAALPAPFLGTIYSTIQQIVMPGEIAAITAAEAIFSIGMKTIHSDNIVFHGDNVYITGSGKANFSGELDFTFQNQLTNASHMDQSITDNLFRVPTAGLGKRISGARLTGTAKTPKWEFEYVHGDIFRENLQKLL